MRQNWRAQMMVGIAGTVTTICAVALKLEKYDHNLVHGRELTLREVRAVLDQLRAIPLAQRKRIPGMVEGRADVIIAGGLILERLMIVFGMDSLKVCDQGIRWGLVYEAMEAKTAS